MTKGETAMSECVKCGASITPTAKFCSECGATQVSLPTEALEYRVPSEIPSIRPEVIAPSSDDGEGRQLSSAPKSVAAAEAMAKSGRIPLPLLILGGLAVIVIFIMIVRTGGPGKEVQPVENSASPVPVVGCNPDGQIVQLGGLTISSDVLQIGSEEAQRLAYFKPGAGRGILVPRNWYCLGSSGSSGSVLYLTPERINAEAFSSQDWEGFTGPVIVFANKSGGTSGRFEVAEAIIRAFPTHMTFARRVIAEGLQTHFPSGPSPTDRLKRFSNEYVEFNTPENTEGFGTDSGLQKNGSPISGVAILKGEDTDLVQLTVRLSADSSELAQAIVRQFEQQQEQERMAVLMGTPIDFATLYAKAYGTGLEIGRRYQVTARVYGDLTGLTSPTSNESIDGDHDFDDSTQLEAVIKQAVSKPSNADLLCTVVVSMGYSHRLLIHRAEKCQTISRY
jgi:hypothetical protein